MQDKWITLPNSEVVISPTYTTLWWARPSLTNDRHSHQSVEHISLGCPDNIPTAIIQKLGGPGWSCDTYTDLSTNTDSTSGCVEGGEFQCRPILDHSHPMGLLQWYNHDVTYDGTIRAANPVCFWLEVQIYILLTKNKLLGWDLRLAKNVKTCSKTFFSVQRKLFFW